MKSNTNNFNQKFLNKFKNKRVLITGHTGFKGSWLTIWLDLLGAKLYGLALDPPTTPSIFEEAKLNKIIDRTKKGGMVEHGIKYFNSVEKTIMLVTPEGTRSYRKDWKSGFYHIAWGAKVPLILCKVNYKTRTIFIGEVFFMTGDYDKDIIGIKEYFKDCVPLIAENFGI